MILEAIFQAPGEQLLRFTSSGDNVAPIFLEPRHTLDQVEAIEQLHRGVARFVDDVLTADAWNSTALRAVKAKSRFTLTAPPPPAIDPVLRWAGLLSNPWARWSRWPFGRPLRSSRFSMDLTPIGTARSTRHLRKPARKVLPTLGERERTSTCRRAR